MKLKCFLLVALAAGAFLSGGQALAAAKPVNDAYNLLDGAKSYFYKLGLPISYSQTDLSTKKVNRETIDLQVSGVRINQLKTGLTLSDANVVVVGKGKSFKDAFGLSTIALDFDIKLLEHDSYLRLNNYSILLDAAVNLNALKGKWIKFENQDLLDSALPGIRQPGTPAEKKAEQKKTSALVNSLNFLDLSGKQSAVRLEQATAKLYPLKVNNKELAQLAYGVMMLSDATLTDTDLQKMTVAMADWTFSNTQLAVADNKYVAFKTMAVYTQTDGASKDVYTFAPNLLAKNINDPKLKVVAPARFVTMVEALGLMGATK